MNKTISFLYLLSGILLLTLSSASAQKPGWVSSYGAQTFYNQQEYITGFGMTTISLDMPLDEAIAHAEANAQENLVQKVRVQIESLTTSLIEETDEQYTSQFLSSTQSSSQLELFGLNTEHYVDQSGSIVYALAHVRREGVRDQFAEKLNQLQGGFIRQVERAGNSLEAGSKSDAFNQFTKAKSIYAEIMNTWSVL